MMKQYEYEGYYTENGVAPRKVDLSFDENGKYFLIGSKNNTGLMYNVSIIFIFNSATESELIGPQFISYNFNT